MGQINPVLFYIFVNSVNVQIPAEPVPSPTSDKWTILPGSGGTSGDLMAVKGGKAAAEHRKIREGQRLRSPLTLPLFTSPLEASRPGVRKVSGVEWSVNHWSVNSHHISHRYRSRVFQVLRSVVA